MNYFDAILKHIEFYIKHSRNVKEGYEFSLLHHLIMLLGEDGFNIRFQVYFIDNDCNVDEKIYDLMKEESRKYTTDSLMANGGSLKFENAVFTIIKNEFESKGLELMTLSCQLEFTDKVKAKIDTRNEVNTNISVIEQQITEQKKRNELAELKAQENIILSKGLTKEILLQQFIEKWNGSSTLYWTPPTLIKPIQ